MMLKYLIIWCIYVSFIHVLLAEIYDPLNVFCGSQNCYDILGVPKDASAKDIKKAYRKLSLTYHPDKSKEANTIEVFRLITKAHEVLTGNKSRPLFDYYLAHPKDYFKVSGQHYYQNLPKSDVRLIIIVVVALISWFFHSIQYQKYERVVKYLKMATLNNLTPKNGGSKQTQELFRRATDLYEEEIKELKAKGDKNAGKIKMLKDPLFEKVVDKVVAEVKIEGGYRKPEWTDLFAYQLIIFPYTSSLWAMKYYRRYYSNQPLSMEDKLEMAKEKIGLGSWEEMSEEDHTKLIEREIWKQENYDQWIQEMEEEAEKEMKKMKKLSKKIKGKKGKQQESEYDEYEEDEYVE